MQRWRRILPLVAWLGALATGLVVFHALGRGAMAPPPLTDPGAWGAWAEGREPAAAAVAVLRLVVLALAWYLVGATTVGIVARLVRRAGLIRVADSLTLPMVRRLLQASLGITLATAMVGASTAPVAQPVEELRMSVAGQHELDRSEPDRPVTDGAETVRRAAADAASEGPAGAPRLVRAGDDGDRPAGSGPSDRGPSGPVAMRLAEQTASATDEAPSGARPETSVDQVADPGTTAEDGPGAEDGPSVDDGHGRHRVVAGESLWSIARDALAQHRGGPPTESEVLDYWREVVADNRDALADPDNPDLIFPGDEIRLPAVPERA